ncbi:MAG: hypothetical protein ABIP89_12070, partial [Polyangiaceae bacterium]
MNISRRLLFPAMASFALIGLACEGCKAKSDDIPVGAYLSLSGSDSTFGTDTRDGIEEELGGIVALRAEAAG